MRESGKAVPAMRSVWLTALGLPLALLGLFDGPGLWLFGAYNAALALAVTVDLLATPRLRHLSVRRELPASCIQGAPARIALHLEWDASRTGRLALRDVPPPNFEVAESTFRLRVAPSSRTTLAYGVIARERGIAAFGALAVRSRGPLGLIDRQTVLELPASVRVYPDSAALTGGETALAAPSPWLRGLRRGAMTGEGREFHQLRAYSMGDDVRMIDWKGFARRGRPVVREYRSERNQRVLLLIDGGRLMTVEVGGRSRFDWAVQAAGRLARVALGMGDLVGVTVFSREIKGQVPAARGPGHFGRLSEVFCLAQPDTDEPDLGSTMHYLLRRHARRALVVLFSEVADPRAAQAAVRNLGALSPRHLGLMVTMADADLDAERHLTVSGADQAFRRQAADELWLEYRRTAAALESRGVLLVRARADALAADVVQRYMEVKIQGRL